MGMAGLLPLGSSSSSAPPWTLSDVLADKRGGCTNRESGWPHGISIRVGFAVGSRLGYLAAVPGGRLMATAWLSGVIRRGSTESSVPLLDGGE